MFKESVKDENTISHALRSYGIFAFHTDFSFIYGVVILNLINASHG